MVKNLLANAGDIGDSVSIPGLGRSPGGGNGNSLQHSCPGNPRDRGTWWDTVHGLAKVSDVTEHARMHYVLKLHLTSYITLLLIVFPSVYSTTLIDSFSVTDSAHTKRV